MDKAARSRLRYDALPGIHTQNLDRLQAADGPRASLMLGGSVSAAIDDVGAIATAGVSSPATAPFMAHLALARLCS